MKVRSIRIVATVALVMVALGVMAAVATAGPITVLGQSWGWVR